MTHPSLQLNSRKFPCRPALAFITYTVTPQYANSGITSVDTPKRSRHPLFLTSGIYIFQVLKPLNIVCYLCPFPPPRSITFFSTFPFANLYSRHTCTQNFSFSPMAERGPAAPYPWQHSNHHSQAPQLSPHSNMYTAALMLPGHRPYRLQPLGWNFVPHMHNFSTTEFNQHLPLISLIPQLLPQLFPSSKIQGSLWYLEHHCLGTLWFFF